MKKKKKKKPTHDYKEINEYNKANWSSWILAICLGHMSDTATYTKGC